MEYPNIIRNRPEVFQRRNPWVSVDFEFPPDTMEPTIVGLCSGAGAMSAYYSRECRELLRRLNDEGVVWVGHNSVTVEREIIERETGREVPLERVEDTMIRHYLCNAELCKGAAKDEDEEDPRGQGYMDLWSMASLYTELPQWKECRGERCEGPCRVHDVLGYNGVDAVAPDIALPRLREEMREKRIPEGLYNNLKRLTVVCHRMTEQGVKIDRALVERLNDEFEGRKDGIFPSRLVPRIGKKGQVLKTVELVWDAPFNPRSPKQVIEWFGDHGVHLASTEKEEVQRALEHLSERAEEEVRDYLNRLYEYKDAGKGLKPWMNEKYYGQDGLMHPRFIVTGTSMGRLASSKPNFQNVPRVGWGKKVRAAVVPRDESLILAKADYSQLELRICLWYSGVTEELPGDAFAWLVEQGQGLFEKAAETVGNGKSARDLTKSVSHAGDYGEGLVVLTGKDLDRPRTRSMIERGALVVYRDWEYHGGVVGFTGVNLAERLFGSATWENRKKALEIQEAYFRRFHQIRQWQRKVSGDAERGYVQTASGRYLMLLGSPEDKLKIALAAHGQGGGADYVQEAMLQYGEMGVIPVLQIHDELVFELPREVSNEQLLEFFSVMSRPSNYMPGFRCPVKVARGENWLDMTEVGRA